MHYNQYHLLIEIKKLAEFNLPIQEMEETIKAQGYTSKDFRDAFELCFGFLPSPQIYSESYYNAPSGVPPCSIAWGYGKGVTEKTKYPVYYISKVPGIGYAITTIDGKFNSSITKVANRAQSLIADFKKLVSKIETMDKRIGVDLIKKDIKQPDDISSIVESLSPSDVKELLEDNAKSKEFNDLMEVDETKKANKQAADAAPSLSAFENPKNVDSLIDMLKKSLDALKAGNQYPVTDFEGWLISSLLGNWSTAAVAKYGLTENSFKTILEAAKNQDIYVAPIEQDYLAWVGDQDAFDRNDDQMEEEGKLVQKMVDEAKKSSLEEAGDTFDVFDQIVKEENKEQPSESKDLFEMALAKAKDIKIDGYKIDIDTIGSQLFEGALEEFVEGKDVEVDDNVVVLTLNIEQIESGLTLEGVYQIFILKDGELVSDGKIKGGPLIEPIAFNKEALDLYFNNLKEESKDEFQ